MNKPTYKNKLLKYKPLFNVSHEYITCPIFWFSCYVQLFATHGLLPTRLLCPCDFLGKNTGVGYHFLLQGIFLTQESNPGLLHCRWILFNIHRHLFFSDSAIFKEFMAFRIDM